MGGQVAGGFHRVSPAPDDHCAALLRPLKEIVVGIVGCPLDAVEILAQLSNPGDAGALEDQVRLPLPDEGQGCRGGDGGDQQQDENAAQHCLSFHGSILPLFDVQQRKMKGISAMAMAICIESCFWVMSCQNSITAKYNTIT